MENLSIKNPYNQNGETPLHFAAKSGFHNICELFLQNIDNKNPCDQTRTTPLHLAAAHGHLFVVDLFLDYVDDKSPKNLDDDTPYDLAKLHGYMSVCQLISAGIINSKKEQQLKAAAEACEASKHAAAKDIEEVDPDKNLKTGIYQRATMVPYMGRWVPISNLDVNLQKVALTWGTIKLNW